MNKFFLNHGNIDQTNVMLVGSSSRLRRIQDDRLTVMVYDLKLESERQNALKL